jgi:hypothetical protein
MEMGLELLFIEQSAEGELRELPEFNEFRLLAFRVQCLSAGSALFFLRNPGVATGHYIILHDGSKTQRLPEM